MSASTQQILHIPIQFPTRHRPTSSATSTVAFPFLTLIRDYVTCTTATFWKRDISNGQQTQPVSWSLCGSSVIELSWVFRISEMRKGISSLSEKAFPLLAIFEKVVPPHSFWHQVNGPMGAKLSLTTEKIRKSKNFQWFWPRKALPSTYMCNSQVSFWMTTSSVMWDIKLEFPINKGMRTSLPDTTKSWDAARQHFFRHYCTDKSAYQNYE